MDINRLWGLIEKNSLHYLNSCIGKDDSYCTMEINKINSDLNILLENIRTSGIDSLMKRLADPIGFAGARKELEIASYLKRNGFENLKLKPMNNTDIELPTNPPIYIEVYLQHYPEKEKQLDKARAMGLTDKIELSDEEIYSLINNVLDDKYKQLKMKNAQVILIVDFSYSESYERVIKNNIENFNIPDFIVCIVFITKTNIFKFNSSFTNEKIKQTLLLLPSPSTRAGSLWGRN